MSALIVDGLGFAYGAKAALDGVCFGIDPGAFTVLLGPNAAGKSTLFALASGLLRPQRGRITVFGVDLVQAPRRALARIGFVFQQPTLDLDLTIMQNLRYFAALHGLGWRVATDRIDTELNRFALAELAGEKIRKLNGGHRRRVEIARALLHRPDLLLLDEPTVGLDLPARRGLLAHVRSLCAERGLAVLWATHLIDEIEPARDRLVVLHRGRVQASGTVADIAVACGTEDPARIFDRLTGGPV